MENHPDTRALLTMYLEGLGHSVASADTMTGALAKLPDAAYDVLISDIGLPDGDGWELLRRMPEPRPAYAIAMTGFGMNADQLKSKEAGYRRHLLKPFVPDELDSALAEVTQEATARV